MNQKNLLGPIILRFIFFAINLFFAIQVAEFSGWNLFSILLAFFATRDFVHGARLAQIYYYIVKNINDDDKKG